MTEPTFQTDNIKDLELETLALQETVKAIRDLVRDRELLERINVVTQWDETKDRALSNEDKRALRVSANLSTDLTYQFNLTMLKQKQHDLAIHTIEVDYLKREFRRSYP